MEHTSLPLLSVIIPFYNVEKYIADCVGSVQKQSYQNLEIILIDDGSSDGSPAVCRSLAKEDKRIRLLTKPNGGVSSARNLGLKSAAGDYIGFVDADDYISEEMYSSLLNAVLSAGADLAFCGSVRFLDRSDKSFLILPSCAGQIDRAAAAAEFLHPGGGTGCCNKLFKRTLLNRNNVPVLFRENLAIGEDALWCFQVLEGCSKAAAVKEPLYHYRIRENSATQDDRDLEKRFTSIDARKEIIRLLEEYPPAVRNLSKAQLYRILVTLLQKAGRQKNTALLKKYGPDLSWCRKDFYHCPEYTAAAKLKLFFKDLLLSLQIRRL